jgi:hypothetical protein
LTSDCRWRSGSSTAPDALTRLFHVLLLTGVTTEAAASATPGSARAAAATRSNTGMRAVGAIEARCAPMLTTSTLSWSNPRRTFASDVNDRMNRPSATTRTTDKATCATTSALATRPRLSPPAPRPCSFNASIGATPAARNAGAVPNNSAVATVAPIVNARMCPSIDRSRKTVLVAVDSWRTSSRLPHCATSSPPAAPAAERTRLSANSSRISRLRDAPSATLTLNSCRRVVARASSRLAMFAHATSSTSETTTISVQSGRS